MTTMQDRIHDFQIQELDPVSRCAFGDAAVALSCFWDSDAEFDYDNYYYKKYSFSIDYIIHRHGWGAVDRRASDLIHYVHEYARSLEEE